MVSTDNISNSDENLLLLCKTVSFPTVIPETTEILIYAWHCQFSHLNYLLAALLILHGSLKYVLVSTVTNQETITVTSTSTEIPQWLNIIIHKIVGHLKYFTLYPTSFCLSWFRYSTDNCFIWSSAASCFSSRSLQTFFSLSFYKNENECW